MTRSRPPCGLERPGAPISHPVLNSGRDSVSERKARGQGKSWKGGKDERRLHPTKEAVKA
jgi:hypothetical protein